MPRPPQAEELPVGGERQPPLDAAARRSRAPGFGAFERAFAGDGQVVRQVDDEDLRNRLTGRGQNLALKGEGVSPWNPTLLEGARDVVAAGSRPIRGVGDEDGEVRAVAVTGLFFVVLLLKQDI